MPIHDVTKRREDLELITNYDLIASAHALLEGIELDVASSKVANTYVEDDPCIISEFNFFSCCMVS
jgi:hypothetical protein